MFTVSTNAINIIQRIIVHPQTKRLLQNVACIETFVSRVLLIIENFHFNCCPLVTW